LAKTSSAEGVEYGNAKTTLQAKPLQTSRHHSKATIQRPAENGRPISRVELLLAPKKPQPIFKPVAESAATRLVNKSIKLSAQWTDVQRAISEAAELSISNLAFAVHRLGCISSFASRMRREEMNRSGIVAQLLSQVQHRIHELDAGSVTLLLDGCARLKHAPPNDMLDILANLVRSFATALEATQLPLILWAFENLHYTPRGNVLAALDVAVARLAGTMAPQGLTLTLRGFQSCGFQPSSRTLDAVAARMLTSLALFKPSEISACLAAFSASCYQPPQPLVEALAARSGTSVHSNIVRGKRPLAGLLDIKPAAAEALLETPAAILEKGSRATAFGLAAAGRILRDAAAGGQEPRPELAGPKF
jgi:hypothetical protein